MADPPSPADSPSPADYNAPQERSQRETEFTRVVAFTDGVMAIAITLLVLNIEVPSLPDGAEGELVEALGERWPDFLAYALSFAVVGRFWLVHHRVFGSLARFDTRLLVLNLVFLALIVLVPFTSELLGRYGDDPAAPIAYATVMGGAGFLNTLMITHAVHAHLVREDRRAATQPWSGWQGAIVPLVFLLSIPLALLSPTVAELSWLTIFVLLRRRRRRST